MSAWHSLHLHLTRCQHSLILWSFLLGKALGGSRTRGRWHLVETDRLFPAQDKGKSRKKGMAVVAWIFKIFPCHLQGPYKVSQPFSSVVPWLFFSCLYADVHTIFNLHNITTAFFATKTVLITQKLICFWMWGVTWGTGFWHNRTCTLESYTH